eukprot:765566-Hanusia_phi.AAC.7
MLAGLQTGGPTRSEGVKVDLPRLLDPPDGVAEASQRSIATSATSRQQVVLRILGTSSTPTLPFTPSNGRCLTCRRSWH